MTEQVTASDAIRAALNSDWKEAIRINTLLLKKDTYTLDALSRLAFAYMKTGQLLLAKNTYQKVLKLDQYNHIALKNLQKLSSLKKKHIEKEHGTGMSPMMFLEEPGKTKIVECIHLAPVTVLSTLSAGQEMLLKPKNHCVEIRTPANTYVAALPDDLSFKLIKLIAAGNTYHVLIKSVDKKTLKVMLREIVRGKRFEHQPTFIATTSYTPFARVTPASTHDMPDMTPTGEEEDGGSNEETQEE